MIPQVLNRQFVLEQLEAVLAELEKPFDDRRGTASELPASASSAEYDAAARELGAAQQREELQSSGQHGYDDDPDARRGQEPAPIDDSTTKLMRKFYELWRNKKKPLTPAEALRKAQLSFRKAFVSDWAAFEYTGA
jgi:hypothetical protein